MSLLTINVPDTVIPLDVVLPTAVTCSNVFVELILERSIVTDVVVFSGNNSRMVPLNTAAIVWLSVEDVLNVTLFPEEIANIFPARDSV